MNGNKRAIKEDINRQQGKGEKRMSIRKQEQVDLLIVAIFIAGAIFLTGLSSTILSFLRALATTTDKILLLVGLLLIGFSILLLSGTRKKIFRRR